jgi:integrase
MTTDATCSTDAGPDLLRVGWSNTSAGSSARFTTTARAPRNELTAENRAHTCTHVLYTAVPLNRAGEDAQRVGANPVKAVRKPRTQRSRAVVPLAPARIEAIRQHLLAHGHRDGATLVSLLGYAGLRPEEALALQWRHVRERSC